MNKLLFAFAVGFIFLAACKQEPQKAVSNEPVKKVTVPVFNSDTAYQHVATQVAFGPRNPNSSGHDQCKNWLIDKLNSYGAKVVTQDFEAQTYTGIKFQATNIIGQYNPENPKRILLAAHWDTRFIAEEDADSDRKDEPIPGADDGASGVGVLLEIARLLQENPIELGVDILLFDAEDQGERGSSNIESWCLGAQHWAKNPHARGGDAKYGILLDMVGGRNARFAVEDIRNTYEPIHGGKLAALYIKVWKLAQAMGKGNYFSSNYVSAGTDDHYFVNTIRKIPMIDIINKPANSNTSFMSNWHTHQDDMEGIDKRTLRAVGQVVLAVVYKEEEGSF